MMTLLSVGLLTVCFQDDYHHIQRIYTFCQVSNKFISLLAPGEEHIEEKEALLGIR